MRRVLLLVASFAATLALGSSSHAQSPGANSTTEIVPPAYPPPSTRWKGIAVGLGATAFFYGAGLGASYVFPDAPGMRDLRMPVAGPWLAIANNGCPADEPDCGPLLVVLRTVLFALDGVAQAGGLAVALESVFMPTQVSAPASSETAPAAPGESPPSPPPPSTPKPGDNKNLFFLPTPMTVGTRGIGIGLVGRF
jgi:hypothetical protein